MFIGREGICYGRFGIGTLAGFCDGTPDKSSSILIYETNKKNFIMTGWQ